jgi:nucleotide-binding universal stress UspA family protein
MWELHTVLCAADFSGCSRYAFEVARALARDHHARLVVLHVATPPPLVTWGELERALDRRDGYRAELAHKLRESYPGDGPGAVEYRVEDGDPATEIAALAREVECDLLVLGTHGRTGLDRLLLGSVAEKVLRKAPCPVLTVKAPPGTQEGGPARKQDVPPR